MYALSVGGVVGGVGLSVVVLERTVCGTSGRAAGACFECVVIWSLASALRCLAACRCRFFLSRAVSGLRPWNAACRVVVA